MLNSSKCRDSANNLFQKLENSYVSFIIQFPSQVQVKILTITQINIYLNSGQLAFDKNRKFHQSELDSKRKNFSKLILLYFTLNEFENNEWCTQLMFMLNEWTSYL